MKQFLQTIKKAASDAYEAKKPCDFMYGTIESVSPLTMRLDGVAVLPSEMLTVLESYADTMKKGDRVAVIRKSGGQRFLILGRCLS